MKTTCAAFLKMFIPLALCSSAPLALATTYDWTPLAAGTSSWDADPSNWTSGYPNAADDVANLNKGLTGAQVVNVNQAITVGTINLGDTNTAYYGMTIAPNGGSLILDVTSNSAVISKATAGNTAGDTISANIQLNDSVVISNAATAASGLVTVSGVISGAGCGVTKQGAGMLRLTATNAYDGATVINAGSLQLGNGVSGGNGSVAGAITNSGLLSFNIASPMTFPGGSYSGTGTVEKIGTGTLTLTGPWAIGSLDAGYNNGAGVIVMPAGGSLSAGSGTNNHLYVGVSCNSSTLNLAAAGNVTANVSNLYVGANIGAVTSIGTLNLAASNNITASKIVIGGNEPDSDQSSGHVGAITTAGGGTTTILTPYMAVATSKGTGSFTLGANATLNLGASDARATLVISRSDTWNGYNRPAAGNLNLSAGVGNLYLNSLVLGRKTLGGNSDNVYTGAGTLTLSTNSANHLDVTGNSGALGVVVIGYTTIVNMNPSGTLTIGNLDSSSGVTSLDNGTAILIGADQNLTGKGTGTLNLNGGMLTITTSGKGIAGGGGTGALNLNGGATLRAGASSTNWIGGLTTATVTNSARFDTAGNNVEISQRFTGTGRLIKIGAGTLTLKGASAFTGGMTVNEGALVAGSDSAVGTGTLTLNGGMLAAGGTVNRRLANGVDLAADTVVDSAGRSFLLSGIITNIGSLTQVGSGTLTLTGTNTFAGTLNVTSGTLSGLCGSLGGGALTNQATIMPGVNSIGTFRHGGSAVLGGAGTLVIDIDGATNDVLALDGSVALDGALTISIDAPPVAVTTYDIVTAAGGVSGGFSATNGLPPGATVTYEANRVRLTVPAPAEPPVVTNSIATAAGLGSFTLGGRYLSLGRGSVTFCWGTADGGTNSPTDWQHTTNIGPSWTTAFSAGVGGLLYGETYWYRVFASNDYGTGWSAPASPFTAAIAPVDPAVATGWRFAAWTGDADSGISSNYLYSATQCFGNNHSNVSVNGVLFGESFASSGAGWSLEGGVTPWDGDDDAAVTGNSEKLAQEFVYNGSPRIVNVLDLTPGEVYEATLFSVGFEASGRAQTFASGAESLVMDQDYYGNSNGITITYSFLADSTSRSLSVAPLTGNTFHLYALANRRVPGVKLGSIANLQATNVTESSGWINARLNGTGAVYDVWAYWGPTNQTTNAALWATNALVGTYRDGSFALTVPLAGLPSGATNYYTFMASNALETLWALPATNFVTVDAPPAVNNTGTSLGVGQATLRGTLTQGHMADVTIYWGRTDGGPTTNWEHSVHLPDTAQGSFQATVTPAGDVLEHYYTCFASNTLGAAWAPASTNFTIVLWAPAVGGDHRGGDWTLSGTTTVGGAHFNIGSFLIPTGAVANVQPLSRFEVTASSIDVSGRLSADGAGYAGGAGSSAGASGGTNSGCGGGGYGGAGGNGEDGKLGGVAWGDPDAAAERKEPNEFGCGGGNSTYDLTVHGGRGGGAIKLFAPTLSVSGRISADGVRGEQSTATGSAGGGGSGGSIWLWTRNLSGAGVLSATGGVGGAATTVALGGGGGGGRIAVHYLGEFLLSTNALGGAAGAPPATSGQAGTVYINRLLTGAMLLVR